MSEIVQLPYFIKFNQHRAVERHYAYIVEVLVHYILNYLVGFQVVLLIEELFGLDLLKVETLAVIQYLDYTYFLDLVL